MAALTDNGPIFTQIADQIADQVAEGGLAEGAQIPSTNQLAAFYRVNPATAARALTALVERGLAEKRRGVGMFVAAGARAKLIGTRRRQFVDSYVRPMAAEAGRLGFDEAELLALVREQVSAAAATAPAGARA
ncbi:MAG: GntR family transcriptional regulator [Actinomycetia bacterium]|nr:GntR family transcriptional regulator [Actinomycetes bacterium]